MTDAEDLSDALVDIGITGDVGAYVALLHQMAKPVMAVAYDLAALERNNTNIRLAVERASAVVFSYNFV